MKAQTTTARQAQQEEDLFLKGFYGALSLIVKLLRYLGRRSIQHPLVGLLYLLVAFPAAFLIVQDLRLLWATTTAAPFSQPAPIWPLSEPLQPLGVALLAAVIISVCVIDRRVAHRATALAARDKSIQAPVEIDEWVLGRSYERTWNPDPGEFELRETGELYRLTAEHLRTHMIVVAPQGGGKTRSVLKPALHLFKRTGAAVICIDAKGRKKDFDPKEFHLNFDPDDPQNSMRLNVWSGRTPAEMGERLAEALVPQLSEDKEYFSKNAKLTLSNLATAHHAAYGEMPSLKRVLAYVRDSRKREDLAEELSKQGIPEDSEEMSGLWRINRLADQKNDPLGSLDIALAPLATGEIVPLLTTARDGYSIEQLLKEPVRVRFALSEGERPSLAPLVGRLVLAQFTHAVISPDCNIKILKAAVVDEAQSFITPAIAKGMSMARENRGCYILAMQDLNQIKDPTLREDLLSVAGNKMVMAGVGDFDAKKFSALFGSVERPYTTHSQSKSQGSHKSHSRGSGHGGLGGHRDSSSGGLFNSSGGTRQQSTRGQSSSHQQSEGSSVQLRERAEFLTSEIRGLPRFHALIERRDSRGEVTPATIVHLDIETITDTSTSQALRLYKETGSVELKSPRLPHLPPATGHGALTQRGIHPRPEHREKIRSHEAEESQGLVLPRTEDQAFTSPGNARSEELSRSEESKPTIQPADAVAAPPYVPEWVREAIPLIVQRLRIARREAEELAYQAYHNGRDAGYVRDNLEYAAGAPNVENSAELFRFLIRSNQHRYLLPSAKADTDHAVETYEDPAAQVDGETEVGA